MSEIFDGSHPPGWEPSVAMAKRSGAEAAGFEPAMGC